MLNLIFGNRLQTQALRLTIRPKGGETIFFIVAQLCLSTLKLARTLINA